MIKLSHVTKTTDKKTLEVSIRALRSLRARQDVGFFRLPERLDLWDSSQRRGEEIRKKYSRLAICGIGGSSLGGIALASALKLKGLEFFENIDADDFFSRFEDLSRNNQLPSVHWIIISKSGKTMETLTQANFLQQQLSDKGLHLSEHCTVISELRSNPLTDWARQFAVPMLEIPLDVGGRFSVLTPVGLIIAAFSGVSLDEVRRGAHWALDQEALVTELVAQSLMSFDREEWISGFWPYCSALKPYAYWCQQLWAESLAKKIDREKKPALRVSTPLPLLGANDQHSILQQISEGARDKFIFFFSVSNLKNIGPTLRKNIFAQENYLVGKTMGVLLDAELIATRNALIEEGVQSLTVELESINPSTISALFMIMELTVAALGEALNIDAFNQPGVELGKRLAQQILLN